MFGDFVFLVKKNLNELGTQYFGVNKNMALPAFSLKDQTRTNKYNKKNQMRNNKENEEFSPMKNNKDNEQFSPMFAFITQTEQCLPNHWLDDDHVGNSTLCNCHVYVVSYRAPCKQLSGHIFHKLDKKVGWSGGRIPLLYIL